MKFHIYKDKAGEWRWYLKSANGNKVADSAEGYTSKQNCRHGIDLVRGTSNIIIVEDD